MWRIVILGAGYGGLRTALDLDRRTVGLEGVAITIVDRNPAHELVVELHEIASGRLSPSRARIPLPDLLGGRRVRLVTASVIGVDVASRRVATDAGTFAYDHLVIALGSVADDYAIPGVAPHALPLKTVGDAIHLRDHLAHLAFQARHATDLALRRSVLDIVIGGGGFTGIELAGECAGWLDLARRSTGIGPQEGGVTVLEATDRILPGFGARLAFDAAAALRSAGVRLRLNSPVAAVDAQGVRLRDGSLTRASVVLWAGGVRAAPILSTLGLPQGAGGRLMVDRYLRSPGHADISVVGDAAVAAETESGPLHPPSAQMAIQQGRTVARNVMRARFGKPLVRFVPELFGEVISLGRWNAVATIGGRELRGPAAALAKRAAAANYVRSLGGTALIDRLGWWSIARTASGHRQAVVSGQTRNVPEKAGGSMWKSAT